MEDEIFSRYLKDAENFTNRLKPILKQYKTKVQSCTESANECDKTFIEKIILQEEIIPRKLIQISSTKYYYSEQTGNVFIYLFHENKEYLISLLPLQNELLDYSVFREDYFFLMDKNGNIILNISSPLSMNSNLPLDIDTLAKLQAEITSGNFYLNDKSGFTSMNVYHNLPYLNLKLVIGNENKQVFHELNKIEKYSWKIFFIIIPVILILSFFVSQFQKNRFAKISQALSHLSSENFTSRIEENKLGQIDEVEDLVIAFNYMAYELEKFHNLNINKILDMNKKLIQVNQDLEKAKLSADAANHAKTHFLATLSHDIRTPLNAIIGFAQLITQSEDYNQIPPIFQEQIHAIYLSGKNLSELINNILDLSKIEAGKMEINEEIVNLKILLQGIYNINSSLAESKQIKLEYRIDEKLPEAILTDRTKLNQVLMNLSGNAIKFTPTGKKVKIEANREENWIEFKVIDEGIGIPKERQSSIFEVYEQSDKTISTNFGGTGLGLSIVKKITELMNGVINIESELNKGTSISVKLPLKTADQPKKETKKSILKFTIPYKVLVIDDNSMNYEILRFHFKKIGLNSFYANTGEIGLEMASQILPDLILLDLHMPGISGFEVRKQLLENESTKKIPILIMSADVFSDNKNNPSSLESVSDFISKPVDFHVLNSFLEKFLRDKPNS